MLATFVYDFKHGFRIVRRAPRDSFIAAAILSLGIGANTAMFSAMNHVLWRPFPFPDEQRLVRLREMIVGTDGRPHPFNMSSRAALTVRTNATDVFDDVVAMSGQNMTLLGAELPERVSVVLQTVGFENTLNVKPVAGRALTTAEEGLGIDASVALVSYATAQTRFGGTAQALGTRVQLNDRTFTIVGVMPPQYAFPYEGQFWIPWRLDPADRTRDFAVWAHARAGVTSKQIRDAMTRVAAQIHGDPRGDLPGYGFEVRGIRENLLGDQERPMLALTEVVGFMLLIASVNVATLLLGRSVARQREFGIRVALGQSKVRHVSQLIAESLALGSMGCVGGLLLATWLAPLTASLVPTVLSGQLGLTTPTTDWRVATFAIAASIVSTIVAGIVPAFGSWRSNPQLALAGSGRSMTPARRGRLVFSALIVAETALTLVLLAGSGLVIRNFVRLQTQPLGFNAHGLLALELTPSSTSYPDAARRRALLDRLVAEVSTAPGVERVGATTVNPLGGGTWSAFVTTETTAAENPNAATSINHRLITPGLFEAMGIPLLRGRTFTADDREGTLPVAIVSNRLAKRLWPDRDPIGAHIRSARAGAPWTTIVGVVGDVSDAHDPGVPLETWYLPFDQHAESAPAEHFYLMIRDGATPLAVVANVQRVVARVDATLAPYNPVAMDGYFSTSIARERFSAILMVGFAAFGLTLAALGVYGVMALNVSQRTAEFGLRLALGAHVSDILSLAMTRGLTLIAIGGVVGIGMAIALNRVVAHVLTEIGRVDVPTLVSAAALMVGAAVAACLTPAIRAARIDPMSALKS